METEEQHNNKDHLRPWQFKPGVSGNPGGRPKGSISLKEYAKKYLHDLDDEAKQKFMEGLSKDIIWKMAEGNPETKTDVTSDGKAINLNIVTYGNNPAVSIQPKTIPDTLPESSG